MILWEIDGQSMMVSPWDGRWTFHQTIVAMTSLSPMGRLPSGKRLHNCGKSPFFMGKSTMNDHFQ